jgi:hypothetical protein
MSGNVNQAADALEGAFQAADARELSTVIENMPDFARVLHQGLVTLDGEITERGGPSLEQTGVAVAAMAQHAAALADAAEEAVAAFQEESRFWLTGE